MTTPEDRIVQMAQEAGFSLHSFNAIDGDEVMAGEHVITKDLLRFARLVAEDCAKVAEWEPCETLTPQRIAQAIHTRYSKEG